MKKQTQIQRGWDHRGPGPRWALLRFCSKAVLEGGPCWRRAPCSVLPRVTSPTDPQTELKEVSAEAGNAATVTIFKIIFIEKTINWTTYNLQDQVPWHQMCSRPQMLQEFRFIPNIDLKSWTKKQQQQYFKWLTNSIQIPHPSRLRVMGNNESRNRISRKSPFHHQRKSFYNQCDF